MEIRKPQHISVRFLAQIAILLVWAAICLAFFQTQFPYHFFFQEQNQIFLLSQEYIASYFGKPAWVACLVGDFLTQFYYYLYAGAIILTLIILVFGDVLCRSLKHVLKHGGAQHKTASWIAFALAITAMTTVANFSLSETYRLSNIIALAGGAASWWLMNISLPTYKHCWVRVCTAIAIGMLVHWMFGVGYIVFIILEATAALAMQISGRVPRLMSGLFVAASMLPMMIFVVPFSYSVYTLKTDDALLYPGLGHAESFSHAKYAEHILEYDNNYYFGRYNNVINMYESEKEEPSEEMSFFYCLSLEQTGRLAEKLPTLKNPNLGTFLKISEETPLFQIKMINELYYLLGDMTYTERAALLANTFSPNCRNVRMTKRLAEANLISGDTVAAMKYLRILSKTFVYKKWAKDHTPGTMAPDVKAEIERKRQFVNTTDNIRIGDDCYIILTQLLDSNPENTVALDILLCSDMLAHQREVFIRDYEKYGPSNRPIFQQVYNSAKGSSPTPSQGGEL